MLSSVKQTCQRDSDILERRYGIAQARSEYPNNVSVVSECRKRNTMETLKSAPYLPEIVSSRLPPGINVELARPVNVLDAAAKNDSSNFSATRTLDEELSESPSGEICARNARAAFPARHDQSDKNRLGPLSIVSFEDKKFFIFEGNRGR